MADNGFKINKSLNLNPQAGAPLNPVDGDFYYDSVAQSFAYYHNGSFANLDSVGTVTSVLWMTGPNTFTTNVVRNSVVKVIGAGALSHLAGITASFNAKTITIYNAGTFTIVVEPENANELTADNRITTPTGGSMNLVAGEVAVFLYDTAAIRWRLVSISSNAGAQVIATTTNPGIVTLDAAGGAVRLDVNKAVIIAPTLAVTALTVNAFGSAAALELSGPMLMNPTAPGIAGLTTGVLGMESFTNGSGPAIARSRLRLGIGNMERSCARVAIAAAPPWTASSMYYWVDLEGVLHIRGELSTGTGQTFNSGTTVVINAAAITNGLRPPLTDALGSCLIEDATLLSWAPGLIYVKTNGDIAAFQKSTVNYTNVQGIRGIVIDFPIFA